MRATVRARCCDNDEDDNDDRDERIDATSGEFFELAVLSKHPVAEGTSVDNGAAAT